MSSNENFKAAAEEEEIRIILDLLAQEIQNLDEQLVREAIRSCCEKQEIVVQHDSFISCVRERYNMLRLM